MTKWWAIAAVGAACLAGFAAQAQTTAAASAEEVAAGTDDNDLARQIVESNPRRVVIDYGYGPGVRPPRTRSTTTAAATAAPAPFAAAMTGVPPGSAQAATQGVFGAPIPWPIIPIHVALLPDGRVLSFGSTEAGQQGGFVTSVWTPATGAHLTLPNGSPTDIFCAGQTVMAGSGQVFITGGDLTVNGVRNFSTADANIFDPATNTLARIAPMALPRWYPTVVPLPNGELAVLGGRKTRDPIIGEPTPEVFNPTTGWRTLTTASSDTAYGRVGWYYPRAYQAPNGRIFILVRTGRMFYLDPAGTGALQQVAGVMAPAGGSEFTSIMYAPGEILSVRLNRKVVTIDINQSPPLVRDVPDIDALRLWAASTVMADGQVLIHGGSAVGNQLIGVQYAAQLWNPVTRQWTRGATAEKARLYHSTMLLLPDATVLTAGGGAPGPIRQLNAEIYYPPYLYNADGSPAVRPAITAAPPAVRVGRAFNVWVDIIEPVRRVTMVRIGSDTHTLNADQRFFDLAFSQTGRQVQTTAPADINLALPGWYMVFVFNQAGTPSVARLIRVTA
jgi:hypothetical protein